MATETNSGDRQELERLLHGYHTGILTTRGPDGHFHSRPMALQKKHLSPDELWFATSLESQKIHDIETDSHCCLTLHGGERDASYVSISGTAELVRDRAKIHAMWEPSWKPWFPEGADSADLVLIRFRPEHVEYVHPQTGRLAVLFTMVKRLVTHSREEPAPKKQMEMH